MAQIIDLLLNIHTGALLFEGANSRHAHEWNVWENVELPDGMVIIPGVIESMSNRIEHPELVAERIVRYAQLVGREKVIAGSDCGFGTFVGLHLVDPAIAWAKLRSLAEGARLASDRLW
jgi:5-methyltetrahydropteroyltriglutamate--homocysteine methyltransferase